MTADERIALVRIKLERAKQHLRDVEAHVRAFRNTNPYEVAAERNPQTRDIVYSMVKTIDVPTPIDDNLTRSAALPRWHYPVASIFWTNPARFPRPSRLLSALITPEIARRWLDLQLPAGRQNTYKNTLANNESRGTA